MIPSENGTAVSENVLAFGFWNCLKAESKYFWLRTWGRSVYTSGEHGAAENRRIDTTKGRILKIWALGLLGTFGLHYFAVGRFLTGSLRFLYGALLWGIGILVALAPQETSDVHPLRIMLVFLVFALIPAVIDLIIICLGGFRDVFRNRII